MDGILIEEILVGILVWFGIVAAIAVLGLYLFSR